MSVDTTFKPMGNTTLVGVAATQLSGGSDSPPAGANTVRVRCLVTGYLAWGPKGTVTVTAPAAGVAQPNTIGMTANAVEHFEIPSTSFFISSNAAGFEVTPGTGGAV